MKPVLNLLCFLILPLMLPAQKLVSLVIDGSINPASASFIERGLKKAIKDSARGLLIQLNTPGGLLKSTRVIVGAILDAPVPVIVYVAPGGAHAGSAGVFITMAAHVAAMAPGTNIGAAHPVSQGGMDTTMNEKATNDAAAFVRTIAEKRNRNGVWAEEAVRKSVSLTGSEAVQNNVVDLLATDTRQLLLDIDGKTIETSSGTVTLQTKNITIEPLEMTLAEKILNILSDPNLAYILLMLGFYGLLFELYNPGAMFPGIMGVLCLILGLYAMHALPINYAGLALIIFGIILFLLEIKITSYGLLTIGGLLSLLLGSLMLIREDPVFPLLKLSSAVIIATTGMTALFFLFIIGAGLKAQRAKPVTGLEGFLGETGIVLQALDPSGTVHVHGEIWQAESLSGKIEAGRKIRIISMKNFRLTVEPL
ncbi:MAG TPA: nodulation protein NfeD [Chitinophagaceae bacterium]|nr:nodulation protein NfeD [Flavisolibacter sp.]